MNTILTGGHAVVRSLIKAGVTTVFGLPGVQNDWLYNAFYDCRDEIRVIHTRHEQGAGYMALGYYLASGQPGVYNVVPGPGFLNSTAALATAWGLNAKVLCLTGQIPLKALGKGRRLLHEIADQRGILDSLCKWSDYASSPSDIPLKMGRAFTAMNSGRPGPAGLEIAMDVLSQKEAVDLGRLQVDLIQPPPDREEVKKAAQLIARARSPVIFVGGGAVNAAEEVKALAEYIQAPVFSYRTGKGILPSSHDLSFPVPAAHILWKEADAAITIGSHARMPLLRWGTDKHLQVISIDIDKNAHELMIKPDVAVTADARSALLLLLEELARQRPEFPCRKNEMTALRRAWQARTAYLEPQQTYLHMIREELPQDGIFVDELTQIGFASRMLWETERPRTYLSTGHMGTLGWGFQAALGAKVARPGVPVIAVAGDGGFMFGVQELAAAVQHKINVILLLFNNGLYGNVRKMQEKRYDNRVIATDLHNPDFVKLAKAFGANAMRVRHVEALRMAIRSAMGEALPTLIEIPVGNDWPSTGPLKSLPKLRG